MSYFEKIRSAFDGMGCIGGLLLTGVYGQVVEWEPEGPERANMQYGWMYLRSVALALIFAGLVAGLGWLGDQLEVGLGDAPILDPDSRTYWLTAFPLVGIAGVTYRLFDNPPRQSYSGSGPFSPFGEASEYETNWILPSLVVLSSVLFLGVYRGTAPIVFAVLITFVGLSFGPVSRHLMVIASPNGRERARVIFTLIVHGVAFLSMSMIYIHKLRSVFSATAVLVVGILLLIALSEGEEDQFLRRIAYALVGGLMLGQVTWALNYWQATGWTGGAILLICFYLFGGLILTHMRRGVHPRDVVEYGAVSMIAFGIVIYSLFI